MSNTGYQGYTINAPLEDNDQGNETISGEVANGGEGLAGNAFGGGEAYAGYGQGQGTGYSSSGPLTSDYANSAANAYAGEASKAANVQVTSVANPYTANDQSVNNQDLQSQYNSLSALQAEANGKPLPGVQSSANQGLAQSMANQASLASGAGAGSGGAAAQRAAAWNNAGAAINSANNVTQQNAANQATAAQQYATAAANMYGQENSAYSNAQSLQEGQAAVDLAQQNQNEQQVQGYQNLASATAGQQLAASASIYNGLANASTSQGVATQNANNARYNQGASILGGVIGGVAGTLVGMPSVGASAGSGLANSASNSSEQGQGNATLASDENLKSDIQPAGGGSNMQSMLSRPMTPSLPSQAQAPAAPPPAGSGLAQSMLARQPASMAMPMQRPAPPAPSPQGLQPGQGSAPMMHGPRPGMPAGPQSQLAMSNMGGSRGGVMPGLQNGPMSMVKGPVRVPDVQMPSAPVDMSKVHGSISLTPSMPASPPSFSRPMGPAMPGTQPPAPPQMGNPGMAPSGMQGGSIGRFMSDENVKTGIHSAAEKSVHETEADKFLATMSPYTYRYKDPANEPTSSPTGGHYLGVIAQNVERGPTGDTIVKDTPRGKMLEGGALMSAMGAGLGRLHERLAMLEAKSKVGA